MCCAVAACSGPRDRSPDGVGRLTAKLVAPAGAVDSILVEVRDATAVVATQTVAVGPQVRPGDPTGAPHAGADAFFTVPPASYLVSATPLGKDGQIVPGCMPGEATAAVAPGFTTEIVLVMACANDPSGGLDVVGIVNQAPSITSVTFKPSKFVETCQVLSVVATASDADQEPVVISFQVEAAPEDAVYASGGSGGVLTFIAETPGDYTVRVAATDAGSLSGSLVFPVHVTGTPGAGCARAAWPVVDVRASTIAVLASVVFPPASPDLELRFRAAEALAGPPSVQMAPIGAAASTSLPVALDAASGEYVGRVPAPALPLYLHLTVTGTGRDGGSLDETFTLTAFAGGGERDLDAPAADGTLELTLPRSALGPRGRVAIITQRHAAAPAGLRVLAGPFSVATDDTDLGAVPGYLRFRLGDRPAGVAGARVLMKASLTAPDWVERAAVLIRPERQPIVSTSLTAPGTYLLATEAL